MSRAATGKRNHLIPGAIHHAHPFGRQGLDCAARARVGGKTGIENHRSPPAGKTSICLVLRKRHLRSHVAHGFSKLLHDLELLQLVRFRILIPGNP